MDDKFGDWVADETEIAEFNEADRCVCGDGDVMLIGRFWRYYHCGECNRVYISGEDGAVHPTEVLETDNTGLVHASTDWDAFYLLTEKEHDVQDYIEFPPAEATDETWLWAHDGLYIGYLLYRHGTLRATVILDGYRGEGHGTQFIEQWFDQLDEDEIEIMYFDRTEPFIEQLDVPYERV